MIGSVRRCKVAKSAFFKTVGVAILVIGIMFVFCACGGGSSLVGKWANEAENASLELSEDGTASIDGMPATYKAEGDKLTLTILEEDVSFGYALDGDSLTLTSEGESIVFTRVAE
jgi:hypothetical protein